MRLIFGDLTSKVSAEEDERAKAALEDKVQHILRTWKVCPRYPDRDMIRKYGREALIEARRRQTEQQA